MVAAGFSGGEADQLRRAMASWKKNGRLNLFKDKLISGMLGKGYKQDYAEQLFEQIKGFSGYGFPESHSASFAVLAYVSCWLKYYFPAEFYIGLLNSWPMGFYTPSQLIQDAQRHQITIKPVCINNSQWDHTLSIQDHYKEIQLGLRQVKGLQEENLARVMAARPPSGFSHIRQIQQLDILNKHALEALASANALRCVAGNRFEARWQIMDKQSELPLFEEAESEALDLSPSDTQNLLEDYHSTSLSVEHHPIKLIAQSRSLKNITFASQLAHSAPQSVVHLLGCVTCRQAPGTATGVTFLTLEDHTGNTNVVIWQSTARHQQQPYLKATILQVDGILERSPEGVIHVIAGKLTDRSEWLDSLNVPSRDFH